MTYLASDPSMKYKLNGIIHHSKVALVAHGFTYTWYIEETRPRGR